MVLTLTMVLSLAACGNDDANPDQATDSTQVQTGDTTDNNQTGDTQSSEVDLAALRTQILTDCGITDSVNVETDALNNLYGITADQVASSASFNATSGAAFPQEVVMIQAVDASAASDIAAKLESRLNTIAETAASYDPTSLELAENCPWSPTASMWVCSSPPTMTIWSLPSRTHWPNPQPHPENEPTAGQS